jgi:hypothetical protein
MCSGDLSSEEKEKVMQLELAAYGCNRRVRDEIAGYLDRQGVQSFTFYEYFCLEPVYIGKNNPETSGENKSEKIKIICPFIKRYLIDHPLLPFSVEKQDGNNDALRVTQRIRNSEYLKEFYQPVWYEIELNENAYDTSKIVRYLRQRNYVENVNNELVVVLDKRKDKQSIEQVKGFYRLKGKEEFMNYFNQINNSNNGQKENRKREFAIVDMPWLEYLLENDRQVLFLYIPIASETLFYGELLLLAAAEDFKTGGTNGGGNGLDKEKIKRIAEKLREIADEEYLPLLIVFENYFQEKKIKDGIKEVIKPIIGNNTLCEEQKGKQVQEQWNSLNEKNVFLKFTNLNSGNHNFSHPLEKAFSEVWQIRSNLSQKYLDKLERSLVMANYLVCSPGMIRIVEEAITQLHPIDKGNDIPCVLVIGGPGSGKDKFPHLITTYNLSRISDPDYKSLYEGGRCEISTINIASLQPKSIAGVILTGLTRKGGTDRVFSGMLQGLFSEGEEIRVVVLDELNSLDIDSQGVLLRFIENRELVPIGQSPRSRGNTNHLERTKILIVGLMNEDPEMLTKLAKIRSVARDVEFFGGIIGEIVYEYLRNLRRLREDLYQRMQRYGVFRLPSLNERREDLPFLFYTFLKSEAGKDTEVIIEYEAFEILMNPHIDWVGNIRLLQSVARMAYRIARAEHERRRKGTEPLIVSRFVMREVLEHLKLL